MEDVNYKHDAFVDIASQDEPRARTFTTSATDLAEINAELEFWRHRTGEPGFADFQSALGRIPE